MEQVKKNAPDAETQEVQTHQKKEVKKKVDQAKYDRYISLKFLQLSETPLKESDKKELYELENELKNCAGKKPIRTVTAAINNEIVKLVSGIPVPDSIAEIIGEKHALYYFG